MPGRSERSIALGDGRMLHGNIARVAKASHAAYTASAGAELRIPPINWSHPDEDRPPSRFACASGDRAVAICQSGRRHLLQLPARMGRLGIDAEGDQGGSELRYP